MNFSAASDYPGDGSYLQHTQIQRNIGKLAFRPEDNVLDVGCGTGAETKSIAKMVNSVTGIDSSEEMLTVARQNNPGPNITYSSWDARTCGDNPKWQKRFDKVLCLYVLHWFTDYAKALRSILGCLKPGGDGLFLVGRSNGTTVYHEATTFLAGHPKWAGYVQGYKPALHPWSQSIEETEEIFMACGWTNVQCEVQSVAMMSKVQTKLLFKTSLGQTALIPKVKQDEYLEDLLQWALSRYEDETGHVCLPTQHMAIHACKPLQS